MPISHSLPRTIRSLELRNITFPVRVEHASLAPEDRIDALPTRIDTLRTKVRLEYEGSGPVRAGSMQGCWNYGEVYELMCLQDVRTVTGPLEFILDEVLDKTADSAKRQGIVPTFMKASADRLGLAVGYPQLSARRGIEDAAAATPEGRGGALYATRCVGIEDFPLVVCVNHGWCIGSERVEHVDVRREAVAISFRAMTVAGELGAQDLRGLYNYAGLIRQMQNMQGMEVTGPTEQICDTVAKLLEEDATQLGVDLLRTDIEVVRTSYARLTPVIGLTRIYSPPSATSH